MLASRSIVRQGDPARRQNRIQRITVISARTKRPAPLIRDGHASGSSRCLACLRRSWSHRPGDGSAEGASMAFELGRRIIAFDGAARRLPFPYRGTESSAQPRSAVAVALIDTSARQSMSTSIQYQTLVRFLSTGRLRIQARLSPTRRSRRARSSELDRPAGSEYVPLPDGGPDAQGNAGR